MSKRNGVQTVDRATQLQQIENGLNEIYQALRGQPAMQDLVDSIGDYLEADQHEILELHALLAGAEAGKDKAMEFLEAALHQLEREREAHSLEITTERRYYTLLVLGRMAAKIMLERGNTREYADKVLQIILGIRSAANPELEAEMWDIIERLGQDESAADTMAQDSSDD